MFINRVSNSKHSTFKECELKYKYKYVDRYPEPESPNQSALHFGSYVHKVLEDGVRCKTLEEMETIASECRGSYTISESYSGKDTICFENFLKFNSQLNDVGETEQEFNIPLDEKGDLMLNGIIDRVIKGSEGGVLVIDYKTSKREKTKIELFQDPQLQGYVYAVHKLYGVPIESVVAGHYYPLTNNFVTVKYTKAQVFSHINKVIQDVWKIRKKKKDQFRPQRNQYCRWCAFKKACPEFCKPDEVQKQVELLQEAKESLKKK